MNHADVRKCMPDYLEGDLSIDRRAVFDAHLDGCEDCRVEMKELRAVPRLLRGLPDVEPPPMLADDVMRRIRLGEAAPTVGDRIRNLLSEFASPGIAIPAGAMLAAFVLAVTSGQFEFSPQRSWTGAGVRGAADSARLAPIPPEATALARRVFRTAPDSPALQLNRGGDATLVATPPRAYFQLLPASTDPHAATGGKRRVQIVVRPSLGRRFADAGRSTPSSVDDWLAVVLQQPAEFARRQASLSLAEREHWARALARRAVETESADAVVEALRRSGGQEALRFARTFAAEARLTSSQIATSR